MRECQGAQSATSIDTVLTRCTTHTLYVINCHRCTQHEAKSTVTVHTDSCTEPAVLGVLFY